MALEPGNRVGPYEILAVLGRGGMGTVYRALDQRLQRQVALKFLHGDADPTGTAVWHRRLLQEAQLASALNHPNICHVYDVGGQGVESWIAMEYVDGQNLQTLIGDDGLPAETVVHIAGQIAGGLAHAHANGVLHRDLKSANVVRDTAGRIRILDFGIAGRLPAAVAHEVTHTASLAEAPVIQGTLPYLAPEILRSGRVRTHLTDGDSRSSRRTRSASPRFGFEISRRKRLFRSRQVKMAPAGRGGRRQATALSLPAGIRASGRSRRLAERRRA